MKGYLFVRDEKRQAFLDDIKNVLEKYTDKDLQKTMSNGEMSNGDNVEYEVVDVIKYYRGMGGTRISPTNRGVIGTQKFTDKVGMLSVLGTKLKKIAVSIGINIEEVLHINRGKIAGGKFGI